MRGSRPQQSNHLERPCHPFSLGFFRRHNTLLNRGSIDSGRRHYQTKSITLNLAIQRLVVGRLVMLRRALVMRRYRGESGGESCGEGVRSGEVDSHVVREGDPMLTPCPQKTYNMAILYQFNNYVKS